MNNPNECPTCGNTGDEWVYWQKEAERLEARVKELEAFIGAEGLWDKFILLKD